MLKSRRVLTTVLAAAIFCSVNISAYAGPEENRYGEVIDFTYDPENSYLNFLSRNENVPSIGGEYIFSAAAPSAVSSDSFGAVSYNEETALLFPGDADEWAQWGIDAPADGLYTFGVRVNLGDNAQNDLTLSLMVNGEIQYNEMGKNRIRRIWQDVEGIKQDSRGNDLRPKSHQLSVWQDYAWQDPEGYTAGLLKIRLREGRNTVRISSEGQPFYISELKIYNENALPSYAEVKSEYDSSGYQNASKSVKIQAEDTYLKNSSTIYPVADKTSPMTEPSSAKKIRLNTVGGTGWQSNAQEISWRFNCDEAGLYNISLKVLQNFTSGMFTTRRVKIDGKVPFAELDNISFEFDNNWYVRTLGDENGDFLFYFDKGWHTISMEVTYGDITTILRNVNDAIFDMNECYRRIVMISGTKPDRYRDYEFDKQLPGLIPSFEKTSKLLGEQKARMLELAQGKSGSAVTQLDRMIYDLDYMVKNPDKISTRLSTYKDNISGLSSWVLSMANQPLQMDYLVIKAPDEPEPKVKAGFAESMKYSFDTFIASFTEDYDLISEETGKQEREIKVWINLGRDQAGILKDLITDDFTPQSGIRVKLELVQGALIEATLAGRGPDIALTLASSDPVNYAIRGALADLRQFDDFEDVTKRFHPSALIPFEFNGGCYALPDTQAFEMLFYRKDVLSDLGLGVPSTWEQFRQILPIIRKNNMDIGWSQISEGVANNVSGAFTVFNTLLYQKGGSYYSADLKKTDLGSDAARAAFKEATDYYINYEVPQKYDFYTRFRSGDMPLAIQAYTMANMLKVSAPEISGLWDIAPLPATVGDDGSMNRSQTSTVTACVMFNACKDKEAAWEFLKWFTSDDIQAEYGVQLEQVMGASARYATANINAFRKIPWSRSEQEKLLEQWKDLQGVNEVPGSYYTARGIQNAFRTTIYNYTNAYETLHDWQLQIDEEISRKYVEFGLE